MRPYLKSKSGVLVHDCGPRYPGGRGRRTEAPGKNCETLSEKISKSKKGWGHGSSVRALARKMMENKHDCTE
jgi:hypothetical protein